jgi:hypothetical protein
MISGWAPHGVLVAVGSSLGIVNEVFDKNNHPTPWFIYPNGNRFDPSRGFWFQIRDPILSTLFRDPWIIPFVDNYEEFVQIRNL